jgi:hypothetical protein
VIAARPTVKHLMQFTGQTGCQAADQAINGSRHANRLGQTPGQAVRCLPELATNTSILTQDLDTQNRAVEADSRSPGGKGFTGLQAVLQYVFNQPLAINAYSQFGHLLTVDAFINQYCAPYATPQRIANNLATNPTATRQCYSWLGPNQPGINEPDPSNPGGCVPDPGYSPSSARKPTASACKLQPNPAGSFTSALASDTGSRSSPSQPGGGGSSPPATGSGSSGSSGIDLQQTLGRIFSSLAGAGSGATAPTGSTAAAGSPSSASSTPSAGSGTSASQAEQLLNYLLAP